MDWIKSKVPEKLKNGLDWVMVSYYEDDCYGRIVTREEWVTVFSELSKIFPNSTLLMGEVGTKFITQKTSVMKRHYSLALPEVPSFKGGGFWWYGKQDLVGKDRMLAHFLNSLWKEMVKSTK